MFSSSKSRSYRVYNADSDEPWKSNVVDNDKRLAKLQAALDEQILQNVEKSRMLDEMRTKNRLAEERLKKINFDMRAVEDSKSKFEAFENDILDNVKCLLDSHSLRVDCSICLDDTVTKDNCILFPCLHRCHDDCFKDYIAAGGASKCPTCRRQI